VAGLIAQALSVAVCSGALPGMGNSGSKGTRSSVPSVRGRWSPGVWVGLI